MNVNKLTNGFGVVAGSEKQFWRSVPESDDDRIEICQRFEWGIEESGESHVCDLHTTAFHALSHHQNVGRFLNKKGMDKNLNYKIFYNT